MVCRGLGSPWTILPSSSLSSWSQVTCPRRAWLCSAGLCEVLELWGGGWWGVASVGRKGEEPFSADHAWAWKGGRCPAGQRQTR